MYKSFLCGLCVSAFCLSVCVLSCVVHNVIILPQHHVFDGRIARSVYQNNLCFSLNKRTCVVTSIGFVRAEEGRRRRTHEWTTLGGVHSRILGCSTAPSEEGILGHGRTRVHVLQTLWCSHSRRGLPPTDGRVDRVVDASSGWAGDVLRLCRVQEKDFGTGVRGSIQTLAT